MRQPIFSNQSSPELIPAMPDMHLLRHFEDLPPAVSQSRTSPLRPTTPKPDVKRPYVKQRKQLLQEDLDRLVAEQYELQVDDALMEASKDESKMAAFRQELRERLAAMRFCVDTAMDNPESPIPQRPKTKLKSLRGDEVGLPELGETGASSSTAPPKAKAKAKAKARQDFSIYSIDL